MDYSYISLSTPQNRRQTAPLKVRRPELVGELQTTPRGTSTTQGSTYRIAGATLACRTLEHDSCLRWRQEEDTLHSTNRINLKLWTILAATHVAPLLKRLPMNTDRNCQNKLRREQRSVVGKRLATTLPERCQFLRVQRIDQTLFSDRDLINMLGPTISACIAL